MEIGKVLILIGMVCIFFGTVFLCKDKFFYLGHLPGDIVYKSERFKFYFPVTTCLVVSIITSILLKLFRSH